MGKGGFKRGEIPNAEPVHVYLFGKSVDVTHFLRSHPGGSKALKIFQDRDATEQFNMYHSPGAHKKLKLMMAHAPDAPPTSGVATSPVGADFEALRLELTEKGFFEPNYKDELLKLAITLGPGLWGAHLLHAGMPCLGSFLLGFSFYMSGWTSHDYLHHGCFKGTQRQLVLWNNAVGFLLGMWQGFAPGWWRARHNTHHLVTNEVGNDPDIKTAPALTFVRNSPALAKSLNAIQHWQQYYYVPLMSLLDLYWRIESMQYLLTRKLKETWLEWAMLGVHYAAILWLFQGMYPWLAFCSLVRGFLTGIVVFATHYGEEHLQGGDHKMTLVEQTALTSRNITGGYVMNVLTGFISLQTEHHLFPMMPTANLEAAQPYVRAFFKKHGFTYRESNLVQCVKFNIAALEFAHLLSH